MIYVLVADNGSQYEEHRRWNFAYTDDRAHAEKVTEAVNKQLLELYKKAEKFWCEKVQDSDTDFRSIHETAPGKRLLKYMREIGMIGKRDGLVGGELHQVSFEALSPSKFIVVT